jgi:hypothetical protein
MRKQSRNPEQDLGFNSTKITELKSESQAGIWRIYQMSTLRAETENGDLTFFYGWE